MHDQMSHTDMRLDAELIGTMLRSIWVGEWVEVGKTSGFEIRKKKKLLFLSLSLFPWQHSWLHKNCCGCVYHGNTLNDIIRRLEPPHVPMLWFAPLHTCRRTVHVDMWAHSCSGNKLDLRSLRPHPPWSFLSPIQNWDYSKEANPMLHTHYSSSSVASQLACSYRHFMGAWVVLLTRSKHLPARMCVCVCVKEGELLYK